MNTQADPKQTQCPKVKFSFVGTCPVDTCMFWHRAEAGGHVGCTKLDFSVLTGVDLATVKQHKLLVHLAMSDDPQVQVEASKALLHFCLLFGLGVIEYQPVDYELCKCGVREDACSHNDSCAFRAKWTTWLLQLCRPLISLNGQITHRQQANLMLRTLMLHHKNHRLPPLLETILPKLAISKRNV